MRDLDLDRLFNPRHLAMIGASGVFGKWGFMILLNILKGQYLGRVYAVNPRQESVLGLPCYRSVREVPGPVDLAVITTPASSVPQVIQECGEKGIPNAVVVSSDFSETGERGAELEREVVTCARGFGMHLVGPNSMGIFSARSSLHALMPPVRPLHGPVSMFSQSGNVGTQMLFWGLNEGVGFEKFVSSGNEGDLSCIDYLRYFAQDPATSIIIGYLEGVEDGAQFVSVARSVSSEKPLILFKGGRTEAGGKAAASHTGAMAGSLEIYRGGFVQAGVIEVFTTQELLDTAKALALCPIPRGNRVAILTRGGGWGVITADACAEYGLVVPSLPHEVIAKLDAILPPYWSRGNPVDMVAVVRMEAYTACLEVLAHWDGVDSVIALGGSNEGMMEYLGDLETLERLGIPTETFSQMEATVREEDREASSFTRQLMEETGKPIILVNMRPRDRYAQPAGGEGLAIYPTPERAVRALKHMARYRAFLSRSASQKGLGGGI